MEPATRAADVVVTRAQICFFRYLGLRSQSRVFVKSCVCEASGGDLMSVHLCSVFEFDPLNY